LVVFVRRIGTLPGITFSFKQPGPRWPFRDDDDRGGRRWASGGISYSVEIEGRAPEEDLRSPVGHVDEIAEIPNSLRRGTRVRLDHAVVRTAGP
jgi:hypothetical protein